MHTVVETPTYLALASKAGMTDAEMKAAVDLVSADPLAGDAIVGSGGCRKVRLARKGGGKSGGYRLMSFFGGLDMPVFLIAVLSKGSAGNFSDAQIKQMRQMTSLLKAYAPIPGQRA